MTLPSSLSGPVPSSASAPLVVIPCLNEAAHLDDLLGALLSHQGGHEQLFVVADGGSDDGSQEIVRRRAERTPNLVLLHNPKRLQSAGVNAAALQFGDGRRYLVRVDAHAKYPKDFVARLTATAEAQGADSVVVPMKTAGTRCFQIAAAAAQNSPIGTGGAAHRMGDASGWVDHGHHALMRLERFNSLGGYDERFSHNEDAEYDLRLNHADGRVWMARELAIGYFPRETAAALFRQYRNYGRGRGRTVRLHQVRLKPRQAAPLLVVPALILALVAPLAAAASPLAWMLSAPAILWGLACMVGGAAAAVKARQRCAWIAAPVAMIIHVAWSLGFWSELLLHRRLTSRDLS